MTNKALAKLYVVPTTPRGDKETTSTDELQYLYDKTGDEVFLKTIEIRGLDTVINNFIPNWAPASDGCVHTTWGFKAAKLGS